MSSQRKVGQFQAISPSSPPINTDIKKKESSGPTTDRHKRPTNELQISREFQQDINRTVGSTNALASTEEYADIECPELKTLDLTIETVESHYLGCIKIVADNVLNFINLLETSDDFEVFKQWQITIRSHDSDKQEVQFWVSYQNPEKLNYFLSTLPETSTVEFTSTDRPKFRILKTAEGSIPLVQDPLTKVNLKTLKKTSGKGFSPNLKTSTLQNSQDVLPNTEIATLTIDLSFLTDEDVTDTLWTKTGLNTYSAHPDIRISFSAQGYLQIFNTSERGVSELVKLAEKIKGKLPHANILLNEHSTSTYKRRLIQFENHPVIPPNSTTGVCYMPSALIAKLRDPRFMHKVKPNLSTTCNDEFVLIESIEHCHRYRLHKMVGDPHIQTTAELNNNLRNSPEHIFYVVGKSGSGKSTIISEATLRFSSITASFSPLNAAMQGSGFIEITQQILFQAMSSLEKLNINSPLLNDLIKSIKELLDIPPHIARNSLEDFKNHTIQVLKVLARINQSQKKFVLVIEDRHFTDPVSAKFLEDFLLEIKSTFQEQSQFKVIVSSRPVSEYAIPELAQAREHFYVPKIPFAKEQRYFSPEFLENPIASNIKLRTNLHEENITNFTLGFIQSEYPDQFKKLPKKVNCFNIYRLIKYAKGNPYNAQLIIRGALLESAIYINSDGALDVQESYLIKIENQFCVNSQFTPATDDTSNPAFHQILLNQLQHFTPETLNITGVLSLLRTTTLSNLITICKEFFNYTEDQLTTELLPNLHRLNLISFSNSIKNPNINIEVPFLVNIGISHLESSNHLLHIIRHILSNHSETIDQSTQFRLTCILAKSIGNIDQESRTFWENLLEQVTSQLEANPSTHQAEIIFELLYKIPVIQYRINQLKNTHPGNQNQSILNRIFSKPKAQSKKTQSQNPSLDIIDKIIVISGLCGLFASLSDNDKDRVKLIETDLYPIFSESNIEAFQTSAENFANYLIFNYYLLQDTNKLKELIGEYSRRFKKTKLSHVFYLLFRLQNKKIDIEILNRYIDPLKAIPNRKKLIGLSGYQAAQELTKINCSVLASSNIEAENNEVERIKLRIPFEITRKKLESEAETYRDSKEYYPLQSISDTDLVNCQQRIEELEKLLKEYEVNPNDFHEFTKLWTLEQLIQELKFLLESSKFDSKNISKTKQNEKKQEDLRRRIANLAIELTEYASNANQYITAVRAYRNTSQILWATAHSFSSFNQSITLDNIDPFYKNFFSRYLPTINCLEKCLQHMTRTNLSTHPYYEIISSDLLCYIATAIRNNEEEALNIDTFKELIRLLALFNQTAITVSDNFWKENELDEYATLEWGAIGYIIKFLEQLKQLRNLTINETPTSSVEINLNESSINVQIDGSSSSKFELEKTLNQLKDIIGKKMKKTKIEDAIKKLKTKESPTGIVDTYLDGLSYILENNLYFNSHPNQDER